MSYELVGVLSLFAWQLCAQVDTSIVAGSIKDPSGVLIAGAEVHFVRDATGVEVSTTTGSAGECVSNTPQFNNVEPRRRASSARPGRCLLFSERRGRFSWWGSCTFNAATSPYGRLMRAL